MKYIIKNCKCMSVKEKIVLIDIPVNIIKNKNKIKLIFKKANFYFDATGDNIEKAEDIFRSTFYWYSIILITSV